MKKKFGWIIVAVLMVLVIGSASVLYRQFGSEVEREEMVTEESSEDLELILILGQPRRRLFAVFASEGLLLALLTTLAVCILCPVFTFVVFKSLEANQFPFAYSAMDKAALVGGVVYSALCAFLTTLFNFFLFFPNKKRKKIAQNPFGDLSKKVRQFFCRVFFSRTGIFPQDNGTFGLSFFHEQKISKAQKRQCT